MRIPDWRKVAKKLRRMDRHELADRSRQEFSKRWDTLLSRANYDFSRDAFGSGLPEAAVFFFNPGQVEELIRLLRERVPRQVEQIIARAERILSHRLDLLGYDDLDNGTPIDWHLDAVHDKRAPVKPFYSVQYLSFAEVGDSKVTWELNRHQHLVTLAKAHRLTRDRRYADEILTQWQAWQAANPYPLGINWASSLEVGFRGISWMWVYHLLEGTEGLPVGFRREWLRAQALNGRHLERYLSTYFSPNTHLLGEGVALFFLGTLCPELADAKRWKALGWQIVLQEARRQVNPDGMHFEQSTYYHVYALDFFLHAVVLASLNSVSVPAELEQTLERMLTALSRLGGGGPPPTFGDDDGGRVFDPARNRAEHLLDPLAIGAILFSRGEFKSQVKALSEESIWLLGAAGVNQWDNLDPSPVSRSSRALPQSGVFILGNQSGQLTMDGGSAVEQSRGHDHADALSLCFQSNGRALLIDPGTCEYVGAGEQRNTFRGTGMHNTLCVDSKDQCDPDGPFSWKQNVHSVAEAWISGETLDLFIGSHDGYQGLASPVLHRRWVIALKSGVFLVRDIAEGQGTHHLDISWHLAPDLVVQGEQVFRIKDAQEGLAILPVQNHDWSVSVQKGVCSPAYGRQSAAVILNYGKSTRLPAEFVTVLVPLQDVGKNPGRITSLKDENAPEFLRTYRYETEVLQHTFYFAHSGRSWKSGVVSSDAEFVYVSSPKDTGSPQVALCNGSYAEIVGIHSVRATRKVSRLEWTKRGLSCSDSDALAPTDTNEFAISESNKPS